MNSCHMKLVDTKINLILIKNKKLLISSSGGLFFYVVTLGFEKEQNNKNLNIKLAYVVSDMVKLGRVVEKKIFIN